MARPRNAPYTWIEPPATISAPEATEPRITTSPRSNTTDWPERTGRSTSSEGEPDGAGGAGGAAGACGSSRTSSQRSGRPDAISGVRPQVSNPDQVASAPSTPISRMPRASSASVSPVSSSSVPPSVDTSSTTGRASKNCGERAICASSPASQLATGRSGASTSPMKDRPRMRMKGGVGESALISVTAIGPDPPRQRWRDLSGAAPAPFRPKTRRASPLSPAAPTRRAPGRPLPDRA